jgi:hypothetical protein
MLFVLPFPRPVPTALLSSSVFDQISNRFYGRLAVPHKHVAVIIRLVVVVLRAPIEFPIWYRRMNEVNCDVVVASCCNLHFGGTSGDFLPITAKPLDLFSVSDHFIRLSANFFVQGFCSRLRVHGCLRLGMVYSRRL